MSKPIQILNQTSSDGFIIHTKQVFQILDKIGDKNVAIVSINGNKRTGKSFLLNYFLRYLNYGKSHGNDWVNGINETSLQGFEWRGGAERHTVGIWMWSEPFMVKSKDGTDIALLLLDTQGNFDEKTTFQECGVIFSLSLLLSSTLILNIKSDLSEDKLQFVEFFTYFAESFSGETNSSGELFQRLLFLVRDWENECSYPFGYHDDITPRTNNFKRDVINPNANQCNEAQHTRSEILSYFSHVSSFLMPHPGKQVSKSNFNGETDKIDSDFIENICDFVPLILSNQNIEPKSIGGQLLTGNSLKAYLTKWADIIRSHRIPEAKTLAKAAADVNYMLAMKHSLSMYENKMKSCLATNPTDEMFGADHTTAEEESLNYFLTEPKGKINDDSKNEMIEDLRERIGQMHETFRVNNLSRIEKQASEAKLNAAIAEQELMKSKLLEQEKETDIKLTELKTQILNLSEESKIRELEQKMRLMEENAKTQQNLMQQNLDHMQRVAEIERKNAEEKLEIERKNNDSMKKILSDIKRPASDKRNKCVVM